MKIILQNCTILDPIDGCLKDGLNILIEDKIIKKVTTQKIKQEAQTFNMSGKILMPGLIDAHVHVTASSTSFTNLSRTPASYITAKTIPILNGMIKRGFTTVRDGGGADFGLAKAVDEDYIMGPRILFSGASISQTGGHGDVRKLGEDFIPADRFEIGTLGRVCDGVDAVRKACRLEIRNGATQIKLMVNGGISTPTDPLENNQFSIDEIKCAVEEAENANIYVMAHAYTPESIKRALKCGVKSIEHGNFIDEPTLDYLIEKDAFLVPTLIVYHAISTYGKNYNLSQNVIDTAKDAFKQGLKALALADKKGANIAFGSDLIGELHSLQSMEFALRGQVQSNIEVIRSATIYSAKLLGLENKIGVIKEGAYADILILNDNPLNDLTLFQREETILGVLKDGKWIYKEF